MFFTLYESQNSYVTKHAMLYKIMAHKHLITIAGKPGSGKTSTADRLAELLDYSRYSSGDTPVILAIRHSFESYYVLRVVVGAACKL